MAPWPARHGSVWVSASARTRCSTLTLTWQFKTHAYLFADSGEDGTNLKLSTAIIGLAVVTGLVALLSEYLVDAIDGFTEQVCRRNDVCEAAVQRMWKRDSTEE